MKFALKTICLSLFLSGAVQAGTLVEMKTSEGDITIELLDQQTPKTVANFVRYVEDNFYAGTIFHRVIPNFMAQGGGFTESFDKKQTADAIENEGEKCASNTRYSIAMARTGAPHSATSQFYINFKDNKNLDYGARGNKSWGYCAFGEVIKGQEIVDKLATIPTGSGGPFRTDVPKNTITITSTSIKK